MAARMSLMAKGQISGMVANNLDVAAKAIALLSMLPEQSPPTGSKQYDPAVQSLHPHQRDRAADYGSALLLGCYILSCYWELGPEASVYLSDNDGIARSAALAVVFVAGAYLTDLYEQIQVSSRIGLISRIMTVLGAALICEAVARYMNPDWALPRQVVIAGTISALIAVSGWRILYSAAVLPALGTQKILFLGSGSLMSALATKLHNCPELGIKPLGPH